MNETYLCGLNSEIREDSRRMIIRKVERFERIIEKEASKRGLVGNQARDYVERATGNFRRRFLEDYSLKRTKILFEMN
jgi:hypothetical protein